MLLYPTFPSDPACRGCGRLLSTADAFCDLGTQPLANALLTNDQLGSPEVRYPTRPLVCRECLLVQLPVTPPPSDLFPGGYPFFSGQSVTWLAHCRRYADMVIKRLRLGATSRVIEIGSNDGTMLRRFRGAGIPAVGVEPCQRLAEHALMEGLATTCAFWGDEFARGLVANYSSSDGNCKSGKADLVIANNVLAHVPDLQDFLRGVAAVLAPGGTATFEVPHIANLIRDMAFDQIYAEHHCYFSLYSLTYALRRAGLRVFDVERIPTHGGSLRVYAQTAVGGRHPGHTESVNAIKADEAKAGLNSVTAYLAFADKPPTVKRRALHRLTGIMDERVVGYGASAKCATMLNYLGAGPELVEAVVDVTPAKVGKFLPGVRIPVVGEGYLTRSKPDRVINFCWNWREESEARIRELCPDTNIVYLNELPIRAQEAATP